MEEYCVQPLSVKNFSVDVPASKSILSRALILSAFTEGDTLLLCGDLCEDIRALLSCLEALGIGSERLPAGILVHGRRDFAQNAVLDVRSSGTAARFLTAVLAFSGGDYEVRASAQMASRPMDVLPLSEKCGISFEFLGEEGHLPFRMHGKGIHPDAISCNTSVSTQFASGLMLAAAVGKRPSRIMLKGDGTNSSYLSMTAALIEAFGGTCKREQDSFFVVPILQKPQMFSVEADASAACYFFALALLCRAKVTVRGVKLQSLQGDIRFLELLRSRGADIFQTEEGVTADGTRVERYCGFEEDLGDLADQAPTVAALAPFAETPTRITGLKRLRFKESDRAFAIEKNLALLGVPCTADQDGFRITPAYPKGGTIDPCGDHRIAMAFTLIGLRTGGVKIRDPGCCKKTFENFFDLIEKISLE